MWLRVATVRRPVGGPRGAARGTVTCPGDLASCPGFAG